MATSIRVNVRMPEPKGYLGMPVPESVHQLISFKAEDHPTVLHLMAELSDYAICVASRHTPHTDLTTLLEDIAHKKIYAVPWTQETSQLQVYFERELRRQKLEALNKEISTLEKRLSLAKRTRAQYEGSSGF